jgi:hypothetical protein
MSEFSTVSNYAVLQGNDELSAYTTRGTMRTAGSN